MPILYRTLALIAVLAFAVSCGDAGGSKPEGDSSEGTTAKIATISHGERVDLEKHLNVDGRTVVKFTADW